MSRFRRQCLQTSLVDCSGTCFPQLAQHSRVGFRAACHQYSWSVGSAMAWDGDDSILGFSEMQYVVPWWKQFKLGGLLAFHITRNW